MPVQPSAVKFQKIVVRFSNPGYHVEMRAVVNGVSRVKIVPAATPEACGMVVRDHHSPDVWKEVEAGPA